jgi:zinc D-Ala-D-Ala carboxypeptidase
VNNLRLGKYFYLEEFCRSQYAARHGIIIDPPQFIIDNLRSLVLNVLDPLRAEIGPITVTSGYRPILLNKAIGGARTSQHCQGQAADLISERMSVPQVFDTIRRMRLPYDQVINEFGQWTHVSYSPQNRRSQLIAYREGGSVKYKTA